MSPPVPRLHVVVGLLLAIAAYCRGQYLLGFPAGILYGIVVFGVVWLLARSVHRKPLSVQAVVFALILTPIVSILAFPATINPDVRHFIRKQETDRTLRAEIDRVIHSHPDFGELSVKTTHLKVVNITIKGTFRDHNALRQFRHRILSECPTLKLCPLHWDVRIQDDVIQGLDLQLFPRNESDA